MIYCFKNHDFEVVIKKYTESTQGSQYEFFEEKNTKGMKGFILTVILKGFLSFATYATNKDQGVGKSCIDNTTWCKFHDELIETLFIL